jgi:hypothetical protein
MTNSEMGTQVSGSSAPNAQGARDVGEHRHEKLIDDFIDDVEKEIPRGTYTTEELLTLLEVKPGYLLNLLNDKGQLEPLQPGERVHIKDGMRFYSQAPGGGSA